MLKGVETGGLFVHSSHSYADSCILYLCYLLALIIDSSSLHQRDMLKIKVARDLDL